MFLKYIILGDFIMQKTKLGISVGLLGAAICFSGLFSGYIITTLLAGYVLLFEENAWLKKTGVKVIALMFLFSILYAVIDLFPSGISFIDSVFYVFGESFSISIITKFVSLIKNALVLIETVVFILLGIKAFNQGTISIPIIDSLVNKYIG